MLQRLRRVIRRRHRRSKKNYGRPVSPAPGRPREVKVTDQDVTGLPICKCGGVVKYAGEHVCEDCFVASQIRWPGKVTRARTHY